jgi:hypothetical protein
MPSPNRGTGEVQAAVLARDVRSFRFRRHQLDRDPVARGHETDAALLDYGVQDTGPDGAAWALAIRGASATELAFAWTLRGAPHAYRRRDIAAVAVATAPLSEADAGKRIFDAAKPLKDAGIPALEALRTLARHLRQIVQGPTLKGEASRRLSDLVGSPYLRSCRACNAVHVYENPFRLAALQAGLELEPGTSPPVLRRIPRIRAPMYQRLGGEADARFDVVRNYLRFYGPASVRDVAEFLDAPMKDVEEHWPTDVAHVRVTDTESGRAQRRFLLAEDLDMLVDGERGAVAAIRLLGPYDPLLQSRDRELLVPDPARRKALWPVLGRPGAVVSAGEVVGTWRPRSSGSRLHITVEPWQRLSTRDRARVQKQAERLAAHRGVTLARFSLS